MATTSVAGTPNQAMRWQITLGSSGTVSRMTMGTQTGMLSGVTISHLAVATTLPAGSLSGISGGLQYTLARPTALKAGIRVWMTISGLTTPPAGTWSSATAIRSSTGGYLAYGRGSLTMQARSPCRTTPWPSDYIATENARAGTPGWQIDPNNPAQVSNKLAAYAENPSVACGDIVNLRVNDLDVPALSLTAYRLGYYNGDGARAVWRTTHGPWLLGRQQPSALLVTQDQAGNTINMVTAKNWSRSFSFVIDGRWTPGSYLIAIRTSLGTGRYVPLVVRDTLGVHGQEVVLNSAEWQAYNTYGGRDAYTNPQSQRISFDRPLLKNAGSGNLLLFEYGYIYWAEKQGLDVSYVMDADIFADNSLLDGQHTITLIGHPEYWTVGAFDRLAQARASGTNILSLTANALYWRIDMGSSTVTGPNREFGITKVPGTDTDTFREGALPEQSVLGAQYGCANAWGNATADASWLWTDVAAGTVVSNLVGQEADEQMPGWPTASGAAVVDTIPLYAKQCSWAATLGGVATDAPGCPTACAWDSTMSAATVMAIGDTPGGRVFHASSIYWAHCLLTSSAAGQATLNALSFLENGLVSTTTTTTAAPGNIQESAPDSPGSDRRLAVPRKQRVGVLSPPLPRFDPPDEAPGQ